MRCQKTPSRREWSDVRIADCVWLVAESLSTSSKIICGLASSSELKEIRGEWEKEWRGDEFVG